MPDFEPLLRQATNHQLEQAIAWNHAELFFCNASARGGDVRRMGGLSCTYDGADYQSMIAFPSLDPTMTDQALDEMMAWYRERPNRGIGCWSLDPAQPADLGARLLARGFQDGWQPCWMCVDLSGIEDVHTLPIEWQIVADNHLSLYHLKDLPYTGHTSAVSSELMKTQPERTQQFIALVDGKIEGHASLFFTDVAGLYDVAVMPSARGQGIGKALVRAACMYAKERGYNYAVLNATGRRMYEQVGFWHVGDGLTWWLLPA